MAHIAHVNLDHQRKACIRRVQMNVGNQFGIHSFCANGYCQEVLYPPWCISGRRTVDISCARLNEARVKIETKRLILGAATRRND